MWAALLAVAISVQAAQPPLRTIARAAMSGVDRPRETVARTTEEWAALWRAHAADSTAPAIDFATETVVAVFLGERMSAGYQVEIVGTRPSGVALVVLWSEQRPPPGRVAAQVITSPAHIVAIPRVAGEIRFEKVDR